MEKVSHLILTWDFDGDCEAALLATTPRIQRQSSEISWPKTGTRNVKNLLFGFIKSVTWDHAGYTDNYVFRAQPPAVKSTKFDTAKDKQGVYQKTNC